MSLIQFITSFITAAISIIMIMINVIALWKIFEKVGKAGWKSLIPFYNGLVLFEIIGMSPWWILVIFVIYFFRNLLPVLIPTFFFVPYLFLPFLFSIVIIWYVIICAMINLGRSFGKDTGFIIGLIFLPYIFFLILAFGNDEYMGKNPINDFIFSPKKKIPDIKYCLGCGKKVTDNSMKFCPNCGNCLIEK